MTTLSTRGYIEGRPKLYNDPILFEAKINNYFNWCDSQTKIIENDKGQTRIMHKPYTISGLCLYLGMDRVTLSEYGKDPKFSSTVKQAKQQIENWVEEKSLTGELNPTVSIFNLKNNFGWKDKQEVETTDKTQENYEKWLSENKQKIKDVTPIIENK